MMCRKSSSRPQTISSSCSTIFAKKFSWGVQARNATRKTSSRRPVYSMRAACPIRNTAPSVSRNWTYNKNPSLSLRTGSDQEDEPEHNDGEQPDFQKQTFLPKIDATAQEGRQHVESPESRRDD